MNKQIYVTHTASGFQWGLHPSSATPLDQPIVISSQTAVDFEILAYGPTKVFCRLQNGASGQLRTTEGPTMEIRVGQKRTCSFATSSSGDYRTGTLEVVAIDR